MIGHKQPLLEKSLRSVIETSEFSQLRAGCTLTSIQEDDDWVYVTYADSGGVHKIRSRFLAAADGKTGFTRKNYLEPKGICLEWAERYDRHAVSRFTFLSKTAAAPSMRKPGSP